MYTTKSKSTPISVPAKMRKLTPVEIQQLVWDTATGSNGSPKTQKYFTALQAVFSTYTDPAHWKNAFCAEGPTDRDGRLIVNVVAAAIVWFHGETPHIVNAGCVFSNGYQC